MVNHGFDFNDFLTWENLLAIYVDDEYNYKKINTKFQEFLNRTYHQKPDAYDKTTAPFSARSHFEDIMILLSDFERAVTFSDVVTHREDCDKSAGKDCKYKPVNGELTIVEKCVQNSYNGVIPNEVCHQAVIKPLKELLIWSVLIDEPDLTDIFLGLRKRVSEDFWVVDLHKYSPSQKAIWTSRPTCSCSDFQMHETSMEIYKSNSISEI